MATRTKAETPAEEAKPEDEKPEEAAPEEAEKEQGLTEKIKDYIEEVVGKVLESKPETTAKRQTYRDEEAGMAETVAKSVKELLDKERQQKEEHPEPMAEKAEAETVPAKKERFVERLWK